MSTEPTQTFAPEQILREIIEAYQAARAAGNPPDQELLIKQYPGLAKELRAFFSSQKTASANESATLTIAHPSEAPPLTPGAVTLESLEPPQSALSRRGQFGDYELLEEIARGGMGVVYKARQKSLNRVVALKMILAGQLATPEQVRRFRMEAEEGGSLDHPNLVPIYEVGEVDGQHYFTMKLIDGGSLATWISRLREDPKAAARLMVTIAYAVHYAHQHGVLHRDLKPSNILMDPAGQPHITDFGLAKHLEGQSVAETQSGLIVGTPSYMAPEQASAQRQLTTAVDVYSLGAIFYELLTGRPPFQATTPYDVVQQVLEREPARPSTLTPHLNRDLETICLTCLAKEPHKRYPSAEALAQDLERFLSGEPIKARPVGILERATKWIRRRPAAAALILVCFLGGAAFLAYGWWMNLNLISALDDAKQARRIAETNEAQAREATIQAEKNAEDARQQRDQVRASFQRRLDEVDDLIIRLDGRLANIRAMATVRMEFLHEFLKLAENLLKEQPDDPKARYQAAHTHYLVGDLEHEHETYADAEREYLAAIDLDRKLAKDFPKEPRYRNDLAFALAHRAKNLASLKKFAEGKTAYDEAIRLQAELGEQNPKDANYRWRSAAYRFDQADLLETAGQLKEAEAGYRAALAAMEELTKAQPKAARYAYDLAMVAQSLASIRAAADPAEARRLLERAIEARRQVYRVTGRTATYRRALWESYVELADFLKDRGLHAEVAALARQVGNDFSSDVNDAYNAACFMANAAAVAAGLSQLPAAERSQLVETYSRQAVTMLDRALKQGYTDGGHMDHDLDMDPLRARPDYQELRASLDRRKLIVPETPAQEVTRLTVEFKNAEASFEARLKGAETVAQRKRAEKLRPSLAMYLEQMLKLAEKYKDQAAALDALQWILEKSDPDEQKEPSPAIASARSRALQLLERDHAGKPQFANFCKAITEWQMPDLDQVLKSAVDRNSHAEVRGLAAYVRANSLAKLAEDEQKTHPDKAAEAFAKAEQQLQQIIDQFAKVPLGRSTLGETAKEKLYEIRHLAVGRPAEDIEGVDFDGKKFKLSDYRGKVVMLDFWVNWCGFCRQMYPHEKAMMARLKDRPFALLGVNCDDDKAQVQREIERQGLTWRSWFDSTGVIQKRWQVHAFPNIYLLDRKGIIRYHFRGMPHGDTVDRAVEELLNEKDKMAVSQR